ncbi:MAG TPA: hypothetical protein VEB59_02530 [Gemmatimonadales bacterium]|nr:hypothetical protein [Gemmatimonadales bacterium]
MAVTFYLVARRFPLLVRHALPVGAAYGLLLYGIMNHVVVPLSRAGGGSRNGLWIGLTVLVHMFLIGLPIAVFARRAILGRSPASR